MSIKAPDLEWLQGDVPRAEGFNDTYFSKAGGLAETRHVFLQGNGLPGRFDGCERFTIAELGFGTGLNFLTTLAAWQERTNRPDLTFVTFELFPMTGEQLARALAAFPELASLAEELLQAWSPESGWNSLKIAGANLQIGIGDARELIGELSAGMTGDGDGEVPAIAPIDAWFLDGFSPARNPELWDADLLKVAADLTANGGTLATYTAAGWVRRNLQAAGFEIEKAEGFAGKREMVKGRKP
ncbi:tRNA (5-methylaminomethyl-2-thiouridine)(34)-methyltransferase MnmD [Roseibium aggregatum]|uniref:tRNA (5-methylaminomethyl-2-thiouridine)(34)-methyltransferase MnmD n=1 Tax=Roseibium aggregatum TaxID=187304 RepID=UPI0025ACCC19|nr:tRNA (5-methylaminomethyl-2-thiouridine)(34)-methyltransferase MnmD [Roseibium aggregatum]WJS01496.1 tRNA (5-methylaminomethyl-2-thiouridine)(34)-methyltransferase MnmD [Roseibium aggregatum]